MPRDVAVSRGATRGLLSGLGSSGPALDKATSPLSPVSPRSGHLGPQLVAKSACKAGEFQWSWGRWKFPAQQRNSPRILTTRTN